MRKIIKISTIIFAIVFSLSYIFNYQKCRFSLHFEINKSFQSEALTWSDSIFNIKKLSQWGMTNTNAYKSKTKTNIASVDDTIVISCDFFHPSDNHEYIKRITETTLILAGYYDILLVDSMFDNLLSKWDIRTNSSVLLHIKDLHQMFPTENSMVHEVPVSKILSSGDLTGFVTEPVGVGICNHALLYGCVDIPIKEVLIKMSKFNWLQFLVLLLYTLVFLICWWYIKYFPIFMSYMKNMRMIGNTCIDFNKNVVYLWSGECKPIIGNRAIILKLLLDTAPLYKLSKEEVCQKIWKRNVKDGQALYNVAMSEIRALFITDDPSLELKSLSKEGMLLLVDNSYVKRMRWLHFIPIFIYAYFGKNDIR